MLLAAQVAANERGKGQKPLNRQYQVVGLCGHCRLARALSIHKNGREHGSVVGDTAASPPGPEADPLYAAHFMQSKAER